MEIIWNLTLVLLGAFLGIAVYTNIAPLVKEHKQKRRFARMEKGIDEALKNITPEEMEKFFPKDTRPEGWISIEDSLPMMLAMDFQRGTPYKVKYADGKEGISIVGDHNVWYYMAKDEGITHWWHDKSE